jgi:DNA-3-methyladenine glycosylase
MSLIPPCFYLRSPDLVARELLGKKLVRRLEDTQLEGIIIETEAYFGLDDPASRAYKGMKHYNSQMWGEPGILFIYNVHRYWMLNVVAHAQNEVGGVLVRAIEPIRGVEKMLKNRPVKKITELTSGPGKLSMALKIDPILNGMPVTNMESEIAILDGEPLPYLSSKRVGVSNDLPQDLRFYSKDNPYVSKTTI